MDKFEDHKFSVDNIIKIKKIITSADVESFANMTGDRNPIHFDDVYARENGFQKRIVHGMLVTSYFSEIIGEKLPGTGAIICEQSFKYHTPVYVEEELIFNVNCKHTSSVVNTYSFNVSVNNDKGDQLISGNMLVKIENKIEKDKARVKQIDQLPIIILGGSGGIGGATAKALQVTSHPLILTYMNNHDIIAKSPESVGENKKNIFYQLDMSNVNQILEFYNFIKNEYGSVYGIIHAAAPRIKPAKLLETEWSDIQYQLDVQLKGFLILAQKLVPLMSLNNDGSIVILLSAILDMNPHTDWLAYEIAKSSLHSLMRNLAVELGQYNIRVNAVSPGMTETNYIDNIPIRYRKIQRANTPLNRLASTDDIANIVSYLMSNKNQHITGETINVCGGIVVS